MDTKKKQLAVVTIFAILMHFAAGRYGWNNRYEIYIWTFLILILLFIFGRKITSVIDGKHQKSNLLKIIVIAICFVGIAGRNYIVGLFYVPFASIPSPKLGE